MQKQFLQSAFTLDLIQKERKQFVNERKTTEASGFLLFEVRLWSPFLNVVSFPGGGAGDGETAADVSAAGAGGAESQTGADAAGGSAGEGPPEGCCDSGNPP